MPALLSAWDALIEALSLPPGSAPLFAALSAGGFTFLCTAAGAAAVFLLKPESAAGCPDARAAGQPPPAGPDAPEPPEASAEFAAAPPHSGRELAETLSLGLAAGIMTAAAVWSLLIPALEGAEAQGGLPWLTAAGGLLLGALFLKALDAALPHLHPGSASPEGPKSRMSRAALLFLAITLHNIPEGGSLGLSAAAALLPDAGAAAGEAGGEALSSLTGLSSALALALGIGIQNIPEGAAVALPLAGSGVSRGRAFLFGALSGLVEPAAALLCAAGAAALAPAMPILLAFAAGAMLYVVVEELVPAAHVASRADAASLAFIGGFALMMALDTALG